MGFDDVHMDESQGVKRALAWDEDAPHFGLQRVANLPKELRAAVGKIKCSMSLL